MKKAVIILNILLALSTMTFAQTKNDLEVLEFKLNDFYSVKLKQISKDEYADQKKKSEHLRHKPYKIITDIAEVQKLLGKRLKVFDMKAEGSEEYGWREYEITFKDGTQKYLHSDYSFIAYFPQLEILLFEGGHTTDCPFDLNNSNGVRIGDPYNYSVSPDKSLRINGFYDGQDCTLYFLEKWNKSKKKYEFVGDFYHYYSNDLYRLYNFCWVGNWFWTSNNKVIFTNYAGADCEYYENTEFYEMEIIIKQKQ